MLVAAGSTLETGVAKQDATQFQLPQDSMRLEFLASRLVNQYTPGDCSSTHRTARLLLEAICQQTS